jgi:hypothetical protein
MYDFSLTKATIDLGDIQMSFAKRVWCPSTFSVCLLAALNCHLQDVSEFQYYYFLPQVMSIKTAKYILLKESGGSLYNKFIKKYPFYNLAL